jgi:hypothetical protein
MSEVLNKWDIGVHGDLLEQEAVDFIRYNIPVYEETWKRYIGHQGGGKMADMMSITPTLDHQRREFAELHYTILESLFLMSRIKERQKMIQVKSFNSYTEVLDQLMLYQAYAGRIRDNIIEAFTILNKEDMGTSAKAALDSFYNERHVFVHRRKVPFALDGDQLFLTACPKTSSTATIGFGKSMLWSDVTKQDLVHLDDYFEKSVKDLISTVNSQLSLMCEVVKEIIKTNSLTLAAPYTAQGVSGYSGHGGTFIGILSGSSASNTSNFNTSGDIH